MEPDTIIYTQENQVCENTHHVIQIDSFTPIVLAARNKMALWQIVALSGLFVFLACILVLLFGLVSSNDSQQKELLSQISEQESNLLRLEKSFESARLSQLYATENSTKELNIKPIEWAINHNSQLSFYQPLNSMSTLNYVTQLINQLDDFGFNGSLYIQFHSGRFCQQLLENSQQALVSAEKSLSQCEFNLQSTNSDAVLAEFESFLAGLNQKYPNMKVIFESVGVQFMLQDYPEISEDVTAGQWNKVAKINNRFDFVLVNEG